MEDVLRDTEDQLYRAEGENQILLLQMEDIVKRIVESVMIQFSPIEVVDRDGSVQKVLASDALIEALTRAECEVRIDPGLLSPQ